MNKSKMGSNSGTNQRFAKAAARYFAGIACPWGVKMVKKEMSREPGLDNERKRIVREHHSP